MILSLILVSCHAHIYSSIYIYLDTTLFTGLEETFCVILCSIKFSYLTFKCVVTFVRQIFPSEYGVNYEYHGVQTNNGNTYT
jgi:hypothetical protein